MKKIKFKIGDIVKINRPDCDCVFCKAKQLKITDISIERAITYYACKIINKEELGITMATSDYLVLLNLKTWKTIIEDLNNGN